MSEMRKSGQLNFDFVINWNAVYLLFSQKSVRKI